MLKSHFKKCQTFINGKDQYHYNQYYYIVIFTVLELRKSQFWNCQKHNSRVVNPHRKRLTMQASLRCKSFASVVNQL